MVAGHGFQVTARDRWQYARANSKGLKDWSRDAAMLVVGAVANVFRQRRHGDLNSLGDLLGAALWGAGVAFLAVPSLEFAWHFLRARELLTTREVASLTEENRRLRDKYEARFNLHIDAGSLLCTPAGLFSNEHSGVRDWWRFTAQDVRLTNRSKADSVSLHFRLEIPVRDDPSRVLVLKERDFPNLSKDVPPLLTYLRAPLDIQAQRSESGHVVFLVAPHVLDQFGGLEGLDQEKASLVITDTISEESRRVEVHPL